jgi:hypothetical protein
VAITRFPFPVAAVPVGAKLTVPVSVIVKVLETGCPGQGAALPEVSLQLLYKADWVIITCPVMLTAPDLGSTVPLKGQE